jgi:hypothetical protein
MSTSSLDEKEKEWKLSEPNASAESTKEYAPIKAEPKASGNEKDLEASIEKGSTKGGLSRFQTGTSTYSDASSDVTDAKSSVGKKKWYKRANPLKWGPKPPVPKERGVCPEYQAGWFSLLTFQWMAPLMTVSTIAPPKQSRFI